MKRRNVSRRVTAALFARPGKPTVRCLGAVRVRLHYSPDEPYALELWFGGPYGLMVCSIDRELLAVGLAFGDGTEVGRGRVRISRAHQRVRLLVPTPAGHVVALYFAASDLAEALAATAAVVPFGTEAERIDWDRELAQLREVA